MLETHFSVDAQLDYRIEVRIVRSWITQPGQGAGRAG